MQADVGKVFWVMRPRQNGIEICAKRSGGSCHFIFNTSFSVTGVAHGRFEMAYAVKTADGKVGYIGARWGLHFLSTEPSAEMRQAFTACENSGAPAIGSTREFVIQCMGYPSQQNTTETSAGRREQLVYDYRAYVYIEKGVVTAVQTSR